MVSSIRRTLKVELDVTEITEQASETDTLRSLAAYTMEQSNHVRSPRFRIGRQPPAVIAARPLRTAVSIRVGWTPNPGPCESRASRREL